MLRASVFTVLSLLLHAVVLLSIVGLPATEPMLVLTLPDQVELGIAQPAPQANAEAAPTSAPPQQARAAAKPRPARAPKLAPQHDVDRDAFAIGTNASAAEAASTADAEGTDSVGSGLGFGAAGFGNGAAEGVIIGLHADIDRIRKSSLVLETRALLQLIPEWEKLLKGSGIEPLKHLSRVFVATPNLKRAELVVSARFKGGKSFARRAIDRLAQQQGRSASFVEQAGLEVAPWYSRGPTERALALVADDQLVIARPHDIPRVLAVSAALAERQGHEPEMERASGPAALLAMYPGEAAALSVENARKFVAGRDPDVPQALRISLSPLDEYHATLRVFGYYESEDRAEHALARADGFRHQLAQHPTVQYFGLTSALDEAKLVQSGASLRFETIVTLHQTRYLMAFVRKTLSPRDAPEPSAEPP